MTERTSALSIRNLPLSISKTREQSRSTASIRWLTKSTVRPLRPETSLILPRHFFWNSASPTARHLIDRSISGSRLAATAKANRTYMPLEKCLTGVSRNFSTSANRRFHRICAESPRGSFRGSRHLDRHFRARLIRDETRCQLRAGCRCAVDMDRPAVGSVIRLRIFNSVLLPAPLRPMIPITSP